jgi:predicted dehydrogenase
LNDPLRVGVIGCGNITLNQHAPALKSIAGVRVAAIADPTEGRRQKVQALLGLHDSACFTDYRELLSMGLDYVLLAVPQKFRRPIVEDCAQVGVNVLSEKPIATIPADAQAMIKTMRQANLRYGIVHNYLYYPEYILARELIVSGAIGTLRHVTLNFLGMPDNPGASEYRPQWRHDPAEAGGGILMDMVHAIYLAEFFFASPIRATSAVVDNLDHPGEAVEDFTLVNYGFDSGYATVNMWWGEGPGGLEISGTEGRILVFYENYDTGPFTKLASFTLVNRAGRQEFHPRTQTPTAGSILQDHFVSIHADFAEAVRAGRDPIAPAEAGLRSLEAALAAYTSGAMGHVIGLPLSPDDPVYQRGVAGIRELPLWTESPAQRRGLFGL